MKELKSLIVLFASAFLLSACGVDNSPSSEPSKPTPTPTPTTSKIVIPTTENTKPVFNTEGGSSTVKFTASEAWTASAANTRADDWLSVSPTSGSAGEVTLTITTTANDTYDERSGSITIKCGTSSQTIVVTQKQKDALTITSDKVEVASEGGTIGVEVKANIDFSVKVDVDWISQVNTRALTTTNLSFAVKENSDISKREGHITISSGAFSETVNVYQAGSVPTIVISQNEYIVGADGGDIMVEVSSNVDVEVSMPDESWISQSTTRSMSTNTYVFTITKNEGYDSRKAEIVFSNKDNNLSEKVSISQVQCNAILLAETSYELSCIATTLDFDVQTNVEISVTVDSDWITYANTRALHTENLSFNIAANESEEPRTATITINGGDISQNITVVQKGYIKVSSIELDKTTIEMVPGFTSRLVAKILPENAIDKELIWSSSNTNIATVDDNGKVVAMSDGSAIITVATKDKTKTASCIITIKTPNADDLISFVDGNAKAICVRLFDTNGDRELSYAEAAAVTTIPGVTVWTHYGNEVRYDCKLPLFRTAFN